MKVLFAIEMAKNSGPNVAARLIADGYRISDPQLYPVRTYIPKEMLKAILTLYRYDIFHFYSQTPGAMLLATLMKLFGKKIVYTVHGDLKLEEQSKSGLRRKLWIPFHRYIFKLANIITTPSTYSRNINKWIYPSHKPVEVIPNGYDFGKAKVIRNQKTSGPKRLLIITSFNHEGKQQGVDFLAKVLDTLNIDSHKYTLDIVGPGKNLESYQQKYNRDDMVFHGYQTDVSKFFAQADMTTYVSFHDNTPVVILESIAYQVPALSVDTGGIVDMLPADYVLANDVEAFANRVDEILGSFEEVNLAVETQRKFASKFEVEQVASSLAKLYAQLDR